MIENLDLQPNSTQAVEGTQILVKDERGIFDYVSEASATAFQPSPELTGSCGAAWNALLGGDPEELQNLLADLASKVFLDCAWAVDAVDGHAPLSQS